MNKNSELKITIKTDAVNVLANFPYGSDQYLSSENGDLLIVDLGSAEDTNAAQEQYLNMNNDVIGYKITGGMSNEKKAEIIYARFFGHIDDPSFSDGKEQEILDWLNAGDAFRRTADDLGDEWADLDAEDISANGN